MVLITIVSLGSTSNKGSQLYAHLFYSSSPILSLLFEYTVIVNAYTFTIFIIPLCHCHKRNWGMWENSLKFGGLPKRVMDENINRIQSSRLAL